MRLFSPTRSPNWPNEFRIRRNKFVHSYIGVAKPCSQNTNPSQNPSVIFHSNPTLYLLPKLSGTQPKANYKEFLNKKEVYIQKIGDKLWFYLFELDQISFDYILFSTIYNK